ncbi:hypothetical protein [Paenibacillus segetis]|uniref:Uncharacterized protein n=1 Tax=Paenibacillus segetis TaxID=1325360 RepID=A0ABQ1YAB9_9BACL|nr:hypothetical protein [Paenibacillus segetis]GGH17235.1 hypothetical protein GCM10008013_12450 [Paenibacillus segetis]
MNTIHTVNTTTYQVVVTEREGYYFIRFEDLVTERSLLLDKSESLHYAISSAEKFPELYSIAQKEGFTLLVDEFVNKSGKIVTVNEAFDIDRSTNEFERLLKSLNSI